MRWTLWLLAVAVVAPGAAWGQKATFEDLLADSQEVSDLAEVVRPFVDKCDDKDDEARRECEGARRFLQDHARTLRLSQVVDGALEVMPYQLKTKSFPITVRGCITCGTSSLEVEGQKLWIGVGPKAEVAKKSIAVPVEKTKEWQQRVGRELRTQVIFGFANKPVAAPPAGTRPLAVEILAWRVFNRCTGEVLFSQPASKGAAPITDAARAECPKPDAPKPVAAKPAAPDTRPQKLGRYEIEQALLPAKPKVKACYDQYEIAGRADVVLDIQGDGVLQAAHVKGTFEGTPTGKCLLQALDGLKFPAFKASKQTVEYPFYLR